MKFNIPTDEVKHILEMHAKIKKNNSVILEQTTAGIQTAEDPLLTQLREAVKAGCLQNGKLQRNKSTGQVFYRKPSVQNPSSQIDFFGDMTYKFTDGSKQGKWQCPQIAANAANVAKSAEDAKVAQSKAAEDAKNAQVDLEKVKKEGDWKTKEELLKTDTEQNIENPIMYEKKVVDGTTLYRRVASSGIGDDLTKDQQDIINKWTNKGAKLRKDLDAEQAKTWISKVVSPASEGYFSQDLIMYFDPEITVKDATLTSTIQQAVQKRIPTDQKDCKSTIETYYLAFKKKRPLEPNEFEALKDKTQACKNEYYKDWGILSGGKRMDNYLDIMSGGIGGPSLRGDNSKWRLN
jgi:hypothetical protein